MYEQSTMNDVQRVSPSAPAATAIHTLTQGYAGIYMCCMIHCGMRSGVVLQMWVLRCWECRNNAAEMPRYRIRIWLLPASTSCCNRWDVPTHTGMTWLRSMRACRSIWQMHRNGDIPGCHGCCVHRNLARFWRALGHEATKDQQLPEICVIKMIIAC